MKAFLRFLAKELTEVSRTWRLPVVGGIVLFFALSGPPLAKLTPQLLASMQGQGVVIQIPDPTWLDAYLQWTKNLSQMIALVVIFAAAGSVSSEVAAGTASMVVTKPVSRASFVLAKWVAFFIMLAGVVCVGAGATQALTLAVFGEAPGEGLWAATFTWLAYAGVLSAIAVLLSCVMQTLAAGSLTLGVFFAISISALWRPMVRYTPAGLSAGVQDLVAGKEAQLVWPLVSSAIIVILLLALATFLFDRREL